MDFLFEKFDLSDTEKENMLATYHILNDMTHDLYAEDLENTEYYVKAKVAENALKDLIDFMNIDF